MSKLNEKASQARRTRELTLQLVYQLYERDGEDPEDIFEGFVQEFVAPDETNLDSVHELFAGICEYREKFEDVLLENLIGWRPERVAHVDRAAIFIALYEIYFKSEKIPVAVAIDEAVELAKRYGTEVSGRFVNGVLGNIVRTGSLK